MNRKRCRNHRLALAIAFLLFPFAASAQTLTYLGELFDSYAGAGPETPAVSYGPANRVSASVKIAGSLGPNFDGDIAAIQSFRVTDGVNTFTDATPHLTVRFSAKTSSTGELTAFSGSIVQPAMGTIPDDFVNSIYFSGVDGDSGQLYKCASDSLPEFCAARGFTAEDDWYFVVGLATVPGNYSISNTYSVPTLTFRTALLMFTCCLLITLSRIKGRNSQNFP